MTADSDACVILFLAKRPGVGSRDAPFLVQTIQSVAALAVIFGQGMCRHRYILGFGVKEALLCAAKVRYYIGLGSIEPAPDHPS